MKKERFYYGEEYIISNLEVMLDKDRRIIGAGSLSGKINLPRVTICGIYDTDDNTMSFGVARCSGKDSFLKAKGRELSRKRANESPITVVTVLPDQKISEVFITNARDIESNVMTMTYPIKL